MDSPAHDMDVGTPIITQGTFFRLAGGWVIPVLLLFVGFSRPARALDFALKQVADEAKQNREAVIGATGMAIWTEYATNDAASSITDLVWWDGRERVSLTADQGANFTANAKPSVQSNYVTWIANYRKFTPISWVFVEVPQEKDAPPEIPAQYMPFENEVGDQWFVNVGDAVNGVVISTNAGVVSTNMVNVSTNVVGRGPSGVTEINLWAGGTGEVIRISCDTRNDYGPSVWGGLVAWQKAKGWPFGWEIMMWETGKTTQLTTNYYYDMAPMVQNRQVAWYGWDGYDFEIYLFDADKGETIQITSNRYDDVGPVLWDGVVAWEGYPAVEADVFMWKNSQISKLSDNVEDDTNPRIWNGQVVWQGFDGDDFEIYHFDGIKTVKLTANTFDDVSPDIADGLITWMGYEGNWDAEIFASDGKATKQLTENDWEDRDPKTAAGRIVWTVMDDQKSQVWIAEPQ